MTKEQRHSDLGTLVGSAALLPPTTRRRYSKRTFSIGELVCAAYKDAERVSHDQRTVAVVASQTLANWLASSNHPEILAQLQTLAP